ncbi:hypothetical protein GCM10008171_19530 [Methylopila jiangsuensis]|uniref:Uncharacterized protein n=1 Tax=Methylopila jiangsuensis TaxID=586230 RepID=A0A9W6JJ60_9HYPH|nr:hypothetical protein [Methylopila jiangsuensis]MDR6286951.1 hypothetical protein [Methylopila jiangsuensis]GLK76699.1 hypothetical protein GCM10008171_19530 [Methylopila jiangsuensis]
MFDTLSKIAELEKSLRADANIEDAKKWWSLVESINYSLDFDSRQSKDERRLMEQLRGSVSSAIRQIREQWPSPNVSSVLVASGALKASIERRTTGIDGWPMRK